MKNRKVKKALKKLKIKDECFYGYLTQVDFLELTKLGLELKDYHTWKIKIAKEDIKNGVSTSNYYYFKKTNKALYHSIINCIL